MLKAIPEQENGTGLYPEIDALFQNSVEIPRVKVGTKAKDRDSN